MYNNFFIMKILVIEDHPKLRANIIKFFNISWYLAEGAIHWKEALEKISFNKYDLLILDVNMPIMWGKEFMKKLRDLWYEIPVITLTSNSMLEDKLEMFDLWVDDYLTKPFELKELKARVKVLFKRREKKIENIIKIWNISIDLVSHKIYKNNSVINFWNKHFLIIEFLSKNRGIIKSKVQILEKVWGELEENLNLNSTTLEAHISIIRKEMWKSFIKTIRGVWYVIE